MQDVLWGHDKFELFNAYKLIGLFPIVLDFSNLLGCGGDPVWTTAQSRLLAARLHHDNNLDGMLTGRVLQITVRTGVLQESNLSRFDISKRYQNWHYHPGSDTKAHTITT